MDVKWNNTTAINFCSTEADAVRWCNRVDEETTVVSSDRLYIFIDSFFPKTIMESWEKKCLQNNS